ncbi:MAG: hypothetical protein AB1324_08555 [Candidatus Micrarchaeota archaeon]
MDFIQALALTLATEGAALFFLLRSRYPVPRVAAGAIIASSLTLPFVWFLVLGSGLAWPAATALAEISAFLAEGALYWRLFAGMRLKEAMAASALCNLFSFAAGLAAG